MTENDRVTELEFQLTHVQRNYEQLNEVVIEHAKEIHRLTQRLSKLAGELDEVKNQPRRLLIRKTRNRRIIDFLKSNQHVESLTFLCQAFAA